MKGDRASPGLDGGGLPTRDLTHDLEAMAAAVRSWLTPIIRAALSSDGVPRNDRCARHLQRADDRESLPVCLRKASLRSIQERSFFRQAGEVPAKVRG
jgi:hypothetical protein